MVVKTQCEGHAFTGVDVGAANVRRYFPRELEDIELRLDHLLILFSLPPGFWNGHPEIRDPRLFLWLESKNFSGSPGKTPLPLALIPSGKNSFRLQTFASARLGQKPSIAL